MNEASRSLASRSAIRRRAELAARWLLILTLLISRIETPAFAAEYLLETPDGLLAFQTEQDKQGYIAWVKSGGRSAWLYFSEQLMKPCQQGDNKRCQDNMIVLRDQYPDVLKKAQLIVDVAKGPFLRAKEHFLLALRNGNYLYPVAPSYQLLQAIIDNGGNCDTWSAAANAKLKVGSGGLKALSDEADAEVPNGDLYHPERLVLDGENGRPGLLAVARSCKAL